MLVLSILRNCRSLFKCEVRVILSNVNTIRNKATSSAITTNNSDSLAYNKDVKSYKLADRLIEISPKTVQPYLKLMRLDRPVGSWLLFYPCGWGIASAAASGCIPDLYMLTLFGTGSLIMRGAGCTINDMWDRDLDNKVSRTRNRPLVNGDISFKQALVFLAGQLSLGLVILLQLNWYSVFLGASSMALVISYPLMKRVTHWPQLVLGLAFNWGALLGFSAIRGYVDMGICLPLYVAGVCWTIIYDTLYAHQDRKEDLLIGIKSTAIRFGTNTKIWLSVFASTMIGNLIVSGIMNEQTWPYYSSIAIITMHISNQITSVNIDSPSDCGSKFISNTQVGFILLCGIILGNILKKKNSDDKLKTKLVLS